MKRTEREDRIGRVTRIVRDRGYRACGYDSEDETYQIIKWTLEEVRRVERQERLDDLEALTTKLARAL